MENEEKDIQTDPELIKIYELGYLIVSSLPEDSLPSEITKIKDLISENKGISISEEFPKLKNLAYKISKKTENKKQVYEKAYFGWIKFEAETSSVLKIKEQLDKNPSILRFIIIKTVRENITPPNQTYTPRKIESKKEGNLENNEENLEKKVISEKEIDESIEKLVA